MSNKNSINQIKRRFFVKNSELYDLGKDIVVEFFDFANPCDFANLDDFVRSCVRSSAETLLNHWDWDIDDEYKRYLSIVENIFEQRYSYVIREYYLDNKSDC